MTTLKHVVTHIKNVGLVRTAGSVIRLLRRGGLRLLISSANIVSRRYDDQKLFADGDNAAKTYTLQWKEIAKKWYFQYGRPITVVVPSFNDHVVLSQLLISLRATIPADRYQVIICDDASPSLEHQSALDRFADEAPNVRIIRAPSNGGFATTVNLGLEAASPESDVVLINSDVEAVDGWLATLQYSLHLDNADILCPKLLYPRGSIQYCGGYRSISSPEWFDHNYRFRPEYYLPATVRRPTLFATGAVMYITSSFRRKLPKLDPDFPMAFEDVDYSIAAWRAGGRVYVEPRSTLQHHESMTRGTVQGAREIASQQHFWKKNADFFARNVKSAGGRTRVIFVTQDVGVGGGHRVIFHHLNTLARAGFECELWNLSGSPDWYDLDERVNVRAFRDYGELVDNLSPIDAIKIATWWETSEPVWLASVRNGIPGYMVQDIESSYYTGAPLLQARALASYRNEFNYLTNTTYLSDQLSSLFGLNSDTIGLGYDDLAFWIDQSIAREDHTVLVAARSEPLKNFSYAIEIVQLLKSRGWRIIAFGLDRELLPKGLSDEFHQRPSDEQLRQLYGRSTLFLSTSIHEGFSLPPIEAMACGCMVASTDAVGNREYFRDRENGISIPHGDAVMAAERISMVFDDAALCNWLVDQGFLTASSYRWSSIDDRLIKAIERISSKSEYGIAGDVGEVGVLGSDWTISLLPAFWVRMGHTWQSWPLRQGITL